MEFYYIRHAQSENNAQWTLTGSYEGRLEDPDLTDLGRQQAEILAAFLARPGGRPLVPEHDIQNVAGFSFTHIYCSLMVRAVATGTVVARALDLPLVAWEDIHEVGGILHWHTELNQGFGLPGHNRAYFETHHPDLVLPASLGEEGWWNRPFEERAQRPQRARRFLDDLLERHGGGDDRVAIISHGGFYHQFLSVLLGLADTEGLWFSLNNAAITRIDFEDGQARLRYLNRLDFMPGEMIT
jgi:2,3-bisphosphoglycerate-dependent phosphoglycerate mutase